MVPRFELRGQYAYKSLDVYWCRAVSDTRQCKNGRRRTGIGSRYILLTKSCRVKDREAGPNQIVEVLSPGMGSDNIGNRTRKTVRVLTQLGCELLDLVDRL